jgi:RHS repeat-associated protein
MGEQASTELISLPPGGGALRAVGETFQPDLHTGTGNYRIPLELPPGRGALTPQLALSYSSGNGNGPFGLGWALSVPGVRRKTDKRLPRYDGSDVFVLSGAEDLIPVPGAAGAGAQRYRPRTETLFARIEHHTAGTDHWTVHSKDGLHSTYGTPRPATAGASWRDPAVIADPGHPGRILGWQLTSTQDTFGNTIAYHYAPDPADPAGAQRYLTQIGYADYGDPASPAFLVQVRFTYQPRPDRHTDRRGGFPVTTGQRCTGIETWMNPGTGQLARTVTLTYTDAATRTADNGASLLTRVTVTGHDGDATQSLPPVEFGYSGWDPARRRYQPVGDPAAGAAPDRSLASRDLDLADLSGDGLPDVLQLSGGVGRYWRNRGAGRLDLPRSLPAAPAGVALGGAGVQLLDADGDGRPDLLVTDGRRAGYYPLSRAGGFDPAGYRPYRAAPAFGLTDPDTRLIDLDGDGVADALRTGTTLQVYLNDRAAGWVAQPAGGGSPLDAVSFADPRVKLADMTGDGLTDVVLIASGRLQYWPNLGYGRFGPPVIMANSPRFDDANLYGPTGFDPARLLLGDVDGDGAADVVYPGPRGTTVWVNQSGHGFAPPVVVPATPQPDNATALRLADLLGTGTAGVLWSYNAGAVRGGNYKFLDLTGGIKPYLLTRIDNHAGAVTTIAYAPSTRYAQADAAAGTPWRTTLPFPVHVVAATQVTDYFSGTTLSTEYDYHHGYWDGGDREFRGFARVDHRDTLAGGSGEHWSPPTETRTWFHPGPVGPEYGAWAELDLSDEYWAGDPAAPGAMAGHPPAGLPRRALRDAIRALRGHVLRTELYALDGTDRHDRPYTVTEHTNGLREESPPGPGDDPCRRRIFFPYAVAERTTQWERGSDPMTQCTFTGDYDPYGQPRSRTAIAVPRGRDYRNAVPAGQPAEPYLATHTRTLFAQRDDASRYIVDRTARTTSFEVINDGRAALPGLQAAIDAGGIGLKVTGQQRHFYDGEAFAGLPPGQLGDHGALTRTDHLILTDEIIQDGYRSGDSVLSPPQTPPYLTAGGTPAWTAEYPQAFRDGLPSRAGYAYEIAGAGPERPAGYFALGDRHRYDFQESTANIARGLVTAHRDPLGHDTTIGYNDGLDVLPTDTTDPVGLTTHADYDYRVLQPSQVTDQNGNRTACTYTPLGLLATTAVMGRERESAGDTPVAPGSRFIYELLAFDAGRQPMSVRTIRRVHHVTDLGVPQSERDQTIERLEYSDGFGRLLQTRAQAEDITFGEDIFGDAGLPADQNRNGDCTGRQIGAPEQPRVAVSGWQNYDNKGQVVHKYEPLFSQGWAYGAPADAQRGRKVTMFYDPRGHLIRTVNPDGSEQIVVPGVPGTIASPDLGNPGVFEPTPWEAYTYDPNDNAGRTHPATSAAYRGHWNTPSSVVVDALGRTISSTERNGPDPARDWYTTRHTYDIRGNLLTLTDALGRVAFRYVHDLAAKAQTLRVDSIDAGVRRTVRDAAANVIEQRDSKGALLLHAHDLLHRPSRLWARDDGASPVTLREQLAYGDVGDPGQPAADRDSNRQLNRLGRLATQYDEAGLLTVNRYDFKGNITGKTRQVIADQTILSVFSPSPPHWQVPAWRADWQPPAGTSSAAHAASLLDPARYETTAAYDALNRVTSLLYPQDVEGKRRQLRPQYNPAGALERVDLDGTTYVERIAYNAKGQRVLIAYGNGIMTRYAHDPDTFRLVRLRSEPYTKPDPGTYHPAGPPHQDLGYDYDLAGNIVTLRDRTPGSGLPIRPGQLDRAFAYDPIYRLLSATGRESDSAPPPAPWDDTPKSTDPTRVRAYSERYTYDPAGNILQLIHNAAGGSFTRSLLLDAGNQSPHSNRLAALTAGATTSRYAYNNAGNMTSENTSRHFEWDHSDRMRAYRTQTPGAEPSIHAHYLYDAAGQRVKKLVRHNGGTYDVTVYIDAIFEYRRDADGASAITNNLLHVMDDKQRIAITRVGRPPSKDATPAVKYQLADHLGSSNAVVDGTGALINREEYAPYGETTFGSYTKKRYRYTGKERDEETGLSYHGARYYAPWLARWTSTDPAGFADGLSGYTYCRNRPLTVTDPSGAQGVDAGKITGTDVGPPPDESPSPPQDLGTGGSPSPPQDLGTGGHDQAPPTDAGAIQDLKQPDASRPADLAPPPANTPEVSKSDTLKPETPKSTAPKRHPGSRKRDVKPDKVLPAVIKGILNAPEPISRYAVFKAALELGKPYELGKKGMACWDCSGLASFGYENAAKGFHGNSVARLWEREKDSRIAQGSEQIGDLVYFKGAHGSAENPGHMGMVLGDHLMIHAPQTGDVVKITDYQARTDTVGFTRPSMGRTPTQAAVLLSMILGPFLTAANRIYQFFH